MYCRSVWWMPSAAESMSDRTLVRATCPSEPPWLLDSLLPPPWTPCRRVLPLTPLRPPSRGRLPLTLLDCFVSVSSTFQWKVFYKAYIITVWWHLGLICESARRLQCLLPGVFSNTLPPPRVIPNDPCRRTDVPVDNEPHISRLWLKEILLRGLCLQREGFLCQSPHRSPLLKRRKYKSGQARTDRSVRTNNWIRIGMDLMRYVIKSTNNWLITNEKIRFKMVKLYTPTAYHRLPRGDHVITSTTSHA